MSRIGKKPVVLPSGVSAKLEGNKITVTGPKGTLDFVADKHMQLEIKDNEIIVTRPSDSIRMKTLHGTTRSIIQGMVDGVEKGYTKQLEIKGVGYRCEMKDRDLVLYVGHSHPDVFKAPEGIDISIKGLVITVTGYDKQKVGQAAANIRAIRKPEPYHGKGIRYVGETIVLRTPSAKKKGASAAAK